MLLCGICLVAFSGACMWVRVWLRLCLCLRLCGVLLVAGVCVCCGCAYVCVCGIWFVVCGWSCLWFGAYVVFVVVCYGLLLFDCVCVVVCFVCC